MKLRDYQIAALDATSRAYAAGRRAPLIVAPTGAGKTVIGAEAIRRATALGRRSMFAAPRRELIAQTETKLRDAGIWDVRVIRAQHDTGRADAQVIIGSIQTLIMPRWRGRLPPCDLLIADEAHHMMAAEWRALADSYRDAYLLGLSATPQRADGKPMGDVFDELIVAASVSELIDRGHLAPCRVYAPSEELASAQIARSPAEAYQRWTPGAQAVVFCTTVAQAREAASQFGARAGVVTATSRDRAAVLHRFATGELQVVINCGVLTEGWDCPSASVAILARKFGHAGLYLQCVGRVLRPHPSKQHATVIDLCGSVHVHGLPDADREYSLAGKAISTVKRDLLRQCPTCGAVFAMTGSSECPTCGTALPRRMISMPTVIGEDLTEIVPSVAAKRPFVKTISSKYAGKCAACGGSYSAGDSIKWSPQLDRARHAVCPPMEVSV